MAAVQLTRALLGVGLILSAFALVDAHRSNCKVDEYRVQKDFDPLKFSGRWYAYKYLPNARFGPELPFQNLVINILPKDDGTFAAPISVSIDGNCYTTPGTLHVPYANTNMSAKMVHISDDDKIERQFWVLETDYTIFAVVYSCLTDLNETTGFCPENQVDGWAFLRHEWAPLTEYKDWRIDHRLNYFCSNTSLYKKVVHDQHRCRFPEPMYWTPQSSFNLTMYMGRWYEQLFIHPETLPVNLIDTNYQHNYHMTEDGTISLRISGRSPVNPKECFNRTKTVIRKTAMDGVMTYRHDYNSEDTPYIVVYTDYDSLAFVLGCVEGPADKPCERFQSWVWSRAPNITGAHALWIKRLMDVHGLDDSKYHTAVHNHTCTWRPPGRGPWWGSPIQGSADVAGTVSVLLLTLLSMVTCTLM